MNDTGVLVLPGLATVPPVHQKAITRSVMEHRTGRDFWQGVTEPHPSYLFHLVLILVHLILILLIINLRHYRLLGDL